MPELRIILLVAGVLFLAGLAGWEWWRARDSKPTPMPRREDPPHETTREAKPLPEINVVRDPRTSVADNLPVIEIRASDERGSRLGGISVSEEVAVDIAPDLSRAEEHTPTFRREPYLGQDDEVSETRIVERPAFDAPAVQPAAAGPERVEQRKGDREASPMGPQLVVAWPSEEERRIVALRVVPGGEPRFQGRALRQALSSAGFWHGPMEIYHLPDDEGRVVVSAAGLAQPGTFDPSIMDSQRFSGLNMFAVLPGPLPEREAFDALVHSARSLAERLDGKITDQHGEELTTARISRLRQSLGATAPQALASGDV